MTGPQRNADAFDDAELIAFLQGAADQPLASRVEAALNAQPKLVERMQALDPGLPMVHGAMEQMLQHAPNAGLARALADASVAHATGGAGAYSGWSTGGWLATTALGLALGFAAGIYAGGWRPTDHRGVPPPAGLELKDDRDGRQRAPSPELTVPGSPAQPAAPMPAITVPADQPPVAVLPPEALVPRAPPILPEVVAPAPAVDAPPSVLADGSPLPTPSPAPEPAQPGTSQATADVPAVSDIPPVPAALAPTAPPSATTAWVQAVAAYVQLMTPETLQQTGQSRAEIRARLSTMGRRFGINLRALERSVSDLALKRVDILQFNGRPLLQLGFVDGNGQPVAVCIILRATPAASTRPVLPAVLRNERAGVLNAVHWDRQPLGLLVIGQGSNAGMVDAARRIDRAVGPS